MFFFLAFLLVFPVWMRGGTRTELMGTMPWMALAALGAALLRPDARPHETLTAARMRAWRGFLADPLLYAALAFLGLLALQWWNGPREQVWDAGRGIWMFAPPPKAGLTLFSVNKADAAEMLLWFAPAFAAVLAIRHGMDRDRKFDLLNLLMANAALAAAVGLVQHMTQAPGIYWGEPAAVPFFAAFGYTNQAGAFFTLASVLGAGLLIRALSRGEGGEELAWAIPALALTMLGALLSRSRAAILMTVLMAAVGVWYGYNRVRRRHTAAGRAATLACLAALLATAVYVAVKVPGNVVREEWKGTTLNGVKTRVDRRDDPFKDAAWKIWRDHPWFGVGGWGYSRFLPHYVVPNHPKRVFPDGSANVHDDPLQFLVEFGVFGVGLLVLAVAIMLAPAVRKIAAASRRGRGEERRPLLMRLPPLGVALLAGPALTLAHSFVDLPFRSPAILWTWLALLACAPDFLEHKRRGQARGQETVAESRGNG